MTKVTLRPEVRFGGARTPSAEELRQLLPNLCGQSGRGRFPRRESWPGPTGVKNSLGSPLGDPGTTPCDGPVHGDALGDGRVETYPTLSYPALLYDPRLMVDRSSPRFQAGSPPWKTPSSDSTP